jgi:hypothetical protein
LGLITFSDTYTLGRTPLDEGSAFRRDLYLHITQNSQESDIHDPGGIRTRNPKSRSAANLRLRPRGHRQRRFKDSLKTYINKDRFGPTISNYLTRSISVNERRFYGKIHLIYTQVARRPGYSSRYSELLRAGRSGDRIPVEVTFSAPVQTGTGAHAVSYTMGTGVFPGGKELPGVGVDHPLHLPPMLRKK